MNSASNPHRHRVERPASAPRAAVPGYTLLEVLLVLAILVTITLVVTANLKGGFQTQRLVKAADQIRVAWGKARNDAIKTGRVHVFYHAPEDDQYFVTQQWSFDDPAQSGFGVTTTGGQTVAGQPTTPPGFGGGSLSRTALPTSAALPTGASYAGDSPAGVAGPSGGGLTDAISRKRLPKGVRFLAADVRIDQRSAVHLSEAPDPQSFASISYDDERDDFSSPERWGMPIYFFPDGSSSSAQLAMLSNSGQTVQVYLRGLTGQAQVGRVRQPSDASLQERPR